MAVPFTLLVVQLLLVAGDRLVQHNLLYIVIDDLRPQLGIYGQGNSGVSSPHIDEFGRKATVFTRAYAQQAICGPSRNSFLTGRRPDRIGVWTFTTNFRQAPGGADMKTLPQLFKDAGYLTCGMGKTFHDDDTLGPPLYDVANSWSHECQCPEDEFLMGEGGYLPLATSGLNQTCISGYYSPFVDGCPETGPHCVPEQYERNFTDSKVVSAAIASLRRFKASGKRFFLMVGLRRPHLSWAVPQRFLDAVPQNVSIAKHKTAPEGMPDIAFFYPNTEHYMDMAAAGQVMGPDQPLDDQLARQLRRGYYAAVSFVDSEVGRLLKELDKLGLNDSTAVILHGDHGWQLGEHGEWSKETNFELATRVPLIVRAPWLHGNNAHVSTSLVSLVDIYRSMADLFNLTCAKDVEGTSFLKHLTVPAVEDKQPSTSMMEVNAAFSQYPRPGHCADTQPKDIKAMGYSVRTANWRYTEWKPWNGTDLTPLWHSTKYASELYSHVGDDGTDFDAFENTNVINSTEGQTVVTELARLLQQHFYPSPLTVAII